MAASADWRKAQAIARQEHVDRNPSLASYASNPGEFRLSGGMIVDHQPASERRIPANAIVEPVRQARAVHALPIDDVGSANPKVKQVRITKTRVTGGSEIVAETHVCSATRGATIACHEHQQHRHHSRATGQPSW